VNGATILIADAKRGVTVSIQKKLKRINAVEPVNGHMKNNGHLGRNFLKGEAGDAINRCCAALATTCARFCAS
jgi:IS5 family transposase